LLYVAAIFLPLLGAVVTGFFGRWLGDRQSELISCAMLILSAIISVFLFFEIAGSGQNIVVELFTWIDSGNLQANWALKFDTLTVVMMVVVTVVSAMVHVYSIGYMAKDDAIPRFFAYLNLFTFFMLMLVTADNLVQLFFGWEGVGLASYLLIGFWYKRPAANAAAVKAFVVNRVGDFGFALGIFAIFLLFGSVNFGEIFAAAPHHAEATMNFLGFDFHAYTVICLLLFMGAMGKSAQIGLHTWLPDAMEGPTPVSALIHAATMVTAGVFMVVRLSPLFEYAPGVLNVIAVVGGATAFFAATIAITQNDIKKVIAYSTCSQLGYMFCAIGVSAYGAAIFHLMTHAFFKSLLFLCAGSVIHAMSDEQDMRKMGGIWRKVPVTYAMMWIGSLALAGVPFFAGYYSKDMILEATWGAHSLSGDFAFLMGTIAAFLTAFYIFRLIFLTFHGEPRADEKVMAHIHESPKSMTVPLVVLAMGAIFAGYLGYDSFVGGGEKAFWGTSILVLDSHTALIDGHHAPFGIKILPVILGALGILLAYITYFMFPGLASHAAERFPGLYAFLYNKWYFDELYDRLIVKPVLALGRGLWKSGDGDVIDGVGADGIAASVIALGRRIAGIQSGYVYHYAFAMIIGIAGILTCFLYVSVG